MVSRVQTLRSSTPGGRPPNGTRAVGELYVNYPDNQLGVIDTTLAARDLLAIRIFNSLASYAIGQYVWNAGLLYRATANVSPGAFNAGQWAAVTDASGGGGSYLPLAGGTLTGDLTVAEPTGNSSIIINKVASGNLAQLEGRTNTGVRWDVTLGDQTAESGANAGSDFSINAFADGVGQTPLISTPIFIKRSTGLVTVKGDPTAALGVATKQYVDAHVGGVGTFLPLAGGTMTGPIVLSADPTANLQAATKQYVDTHGGGGGIPDAPNDGKQYARQSLAWTTVSGINDAPNDGTLYGRKSATWSHLTHNDITDWGTPGAGYLLTSGGTMTGPFTPSQTAGIVGTTTNNNATAGSVGEYISVMQSTNITLSSNTSRNITSLVIPAGDWDVTGQIEIGAATSGTDFGGALTLTSGVFPTNIAMGRAEFAAASVYFWASPLGPLRVSSAAPTTIYLVGEATFTSSNGTGQGFIQARRVR